MFGLRAYADAESELTSTINFILELMWSHVCMNGLKNFPFLQMSESWCISPFHKVYHKYVWFIISTFFPVPFLSLHLRVDAMLLRLCAKYGLVAKRRQSNQGQQLNGARAIGSRINDSTGNGTDKKRLLVCTILGKKKRKDSRIYLDNGPEPEQRASLVSTGAARGTKTELCQPLPYTSQTPRRK